MLSYRLSSSHDVPTTLSLPDLFTTWQYDKPVWLNSQCQWSNLNLIQSQENKDTLERFLRFFFQQNQQQVDLYFQQQVNLCDDSLVDDLNSLAATLILDMGYSQLDVLNAIRHSREQYGSEELKAHQLLEYLLDNNCNSHQTGLSTNVSVTNKENVVEKASEQNSYSEDTTGQTSDVNLLLEQNRQLKEQRVCKICLDKEACIVFIPCGHLVSCLQCSRVLRHCAVCRTKIQDKIRVYQS